MKTNLFVLILAILFCSCHNKNVATIQEYAGSPLPGDSAILFAPGLVNTGFYTRDLCMMPDGSEIYFSVNIGNFALSHIAFTRLEKGQWTKPEIAAFANNPLFKYFEPFISPDGKHFFYATDEASISKTGDFRSDIWMMERTENGWGKPGKLPETINSEYSEYFPTVAANGNMYFTREDLDGNFIYQSEYENGEYLPAQRMQKAINAGRSRFNATISENDSMMIVPAFGMPDSYGSTDYYISFKNEKGEWSELINMGPKINSKSRDEYSANWSPDGKYLFFMSSKAKKVDSPIIRFEDLQGIYLRPENGNPNIYWIKSDFISALKEKAVYPQTE
ncbi:MAG: hypothetical protein A2W90_01460 [Bacteroidetes bacterium GWF2_42_66]|nr:MAG: hypothetical protein A2W92_11770 [Bacteroidetes bacterium GWA2_42_15]OFY01041.1 MAG: hypothetical protein A2W89_14950 [Bacteroidetes bacterium GWE2_42_39]OFY41882.1 MAG: hypothetical protein A2W90_01460 [Bacteroidetes bacterium GWF2_42_66]HBL77940.1 hypothetical protein [Prolixibacteraceae bacterium]HCR90162.1 hypothetical protein [Prolixibacteraceae bacterium]